MPMDGTNFLGHDLQSPAVWDNRIERRRSRSLRFHPHFLSSDHVRGADAVRVVISVTDYSRH